MSWRGVSALDWSPALRAFEKARTKVRGSSRRLACRGRGSAKQCALALHRLADVIGDRANSRQILAVGVHQHPEGARNPDLIGQYRPQLGMRRRHEVRQHGDAEACYGGVELRDQIGAAELGGNSWRDLRQVIQ